MPTADGGYIQARPNNKAIAVFVINDTQYSYSITFSVSVPPFLSDAATCTYTSISQLTSIHSFEGTFGPDHLRLNLANGLTIEGQLQSQTSPEITICGAGLCGDKEVCLPRASHPSFWLIFTRSTCCLKMIGGFDCNMYHV